MRTLGLFVGLAVMAAATSSYAEEQKTDTAIAQEQTSPPVQPGTDTATGTTTSTMGEPARRLGPMGITPFTARRLLLGQGEGALRVFVKINMSTDFVGQPTTITPDVFFGLTDRIQVGVVHISPLEWQTPGFAPNSICVTGKSNGCPKVYNNLGVDLQALLLPGVQEIAGHIRYNFDPLDPFRMNILLGFTSKLRTPWFAVLLNPAIQIGLNKRSQPGGPTPDGNKEIIYIPAEIVIQPTTMLAISGQVALWSPAKNFGDFFQIPVGVAALFTVGPMIDIGARFGWDNLGRVDTPVGKRIDRSDARTLTALANIYF